MCQRRALLRCSRCGGPPRLLSPPKAMLIENTQGRSGDRVRLRRRYWIQTGGYCQGSRSSPALKLSLRRETPAAASSGPNGKTLTFKRTTNPANRREINFVGLRHFPPRRCVESVRVFSLRFHTVAYCRPFGRSDHEL